MRSPSNLRARVGRLTLKLRPGAPVWADFHAAHERESKRALLSLQAAIDKHVGSPDAAVIAQLAATEAQHLIDTGVIARWGDVVGVDDSTSHADIVDRLMRLLDAQANARARAPAGKRDSGVTASDDDQRADSPSRRG